MVYYRLKRHLFLLTIYGHDLIHKMQKILSWTSFAVFLSATILIFQLPIPSGSWVPGSLDLPVFLVAVSAVATWRLAYAPYVADYSRYLPVKTPASHTFGTATQVRQSVPSG